MDTVTVKTSELIGLSLDWAVAKCESEVLSQSSLVFQIKEHGCLQRPHMGNWKPSSLWAQGGPIIERELIRVISPTIKGIDWVARIRCGMRGTVHEWLESYGPTPLIAAMRCYVASKLGDAIQIPKGLAP